MTQPIESKLEQSTPVTASSSALTIKPGSAHEDYETTHRTYDLTRLPIGAAEIVAQLKQLGALPELSILDAGCGTGLYIHALSQAGVGKLYGIDAAHEGIRQTALKMGDAANTTLTVGDIRSIPVPDASFDAALYNFVLHHLGSATESETSLLPVFTEAHRVINVSGFVIIGTCSQEQLSIDLGCAWYAPYFPEAAKALAARFTPIEQIQELLKRAGFSEVGLVYPQQCCYTKHSLDPLGPFEADWRAGDSLFAYYQDKPELLAQNLARLQEAIDSGAVLEQINATKTRAEKTRQVIFVIGRKSPSNR